MTLNIKQEGFIEGYAAALQEIMAELTGENTCAKLYDPMEIDETFMHSYAFDMKDGGRHHELADYKDIGEIKEILKKEAVRWIKDQ